MLHGTTVATNMILEGKGAATALVTTRGFRHVLTIGRQDIPRKANLYAWIKPERPVPASRVLEVNERVGPGGVVLEALDEDSVRAAAADIRRMGVKAVAVCLLHSFANPAHEERVAAMLREALPDMAVTASVDILPVVREYERSLATVLNATVMPGVSTYVSRLEQRLAGAGISAPLLLMQSNGGVAGAGTIRRAPALTALSGPAAGVVGARDVAAACGISDLITVDIGGTSADICLIKDGKIGLTQSGQVGDWPLPLPMVDMVTIGAGGGSIAKISEGALMVGPMSAGAVPGPACYGNGGREPTVTDAHVVLGSLPNRLLGGRMALDVAKASDAIRERVADPLGLSVEAAARGILAIIDSHMVGALRVVSVERGHDPRDFTLVPFGGAGPLHGCSLARLARYKPRHGAAGPRRALRGRAARRRPEGGVQPDAAQGRAGRRRARRGDFRRTRFAGRRVVLDRGRHPCCPSQEPRRHDALQGAGRRTRHSLDRCARNRGERLFRGPCEPLRLYPRGCHRGGDVARRGDRADADAAADRAEGGDRCIARGYRTVSFEVGVREVPVYDRTQLGAGDRFAGPAIVSQLDATTFVAQGWTGEVHGSGALLLTFG